MSHRGALSFALVANRRRSAATTGETQVNARIVAGFRAGSRISRIRAGVPAPLASRGDRHDPDP
jgi:hypothetical protein